MIPSGLVSAVTFFLVVPTALIVRWLTFLNLDAVVLYYPSTPSQYENRTLASSGNDSVLGLDLKDQATDYLPLWLSHILQNYNLSQSQWNPQWKDNDVPVAVTIHLTVDSLQSPVNRSIEGMVIVDATDQNEIPQPISPFIANANSHQDAPNHSSSGGDEDHEFRAEQPFQLTVFASPLIRAVGWMLVYFALWCQAFRLRSFCWSLLHVARNPKVKIPSRGHNGYTGSQKDPKVRSYEDIVSKESGPNGHLPVHGESSIREWTPEDDYETGINIVDQDHIAFVLRGSTTGFEGSRLLRITPDPSFSSGTLPHPGSVPCGDSDCTPIDASMLTYRSTCKSSLPYWMPVSGPSGLQSRHFSVSLHSSLHAEGSGLGSTHFHTVGYGHRILLGVSESEYIDPPRSTLQETSLTHLPMKLTPQEESPAIACHELVLYSRHPRAWEIDDLVAAWRSFVHSRGGKRWVVYGIAGIAVLLWEVLMNPPASGLRGHC